MSVILYFLGVQTWAILSGGGFLVHGRKSCASLVRFYGDADMERSPMAGVRIKWAPIKSAERAVEKLARSYSQVNFNFFTCAGALSIWLIVLIRKKLIWSVTFSETVQNRG